ncbi:MAG: MltA domain-containing protein [Desulfobacterales bacterium]|jgi:membrane-bound lytic murein transglycosylase A|nr:MltA domain-containing protein [Desulfobacterales bacterium]
MNSSRLFWQRLALLVSVLVAACVPRPPVAPPSDLVRLEADEVPVLVDDQTYSELDRAIEQSLAYLARVPADRKFRFGEDSYQRDWLVRSLEDFRSLIAAQPDPETLRRQVTTRYRVYRSSGRDGEGEVLFTGYFEPVIDGCRQPGPDCRVPVYGLPEDLLTIDLSPFGERFAGQRIVGRLNGRTVVPYPDRRAIEAGNALAGKAPVLAWAADPVDLFFLHIQGSGRIRFSDGSSLGLRYRATNGRPYRGIGGLLIETGEISREAMSMQAIKAHLRDHPERREEVLTHNPSYVFFETGQGDPVGSLGVPLTPGRSLATDPSCFPRAALVFVQCQKPRLTASNRIDAWVPFGRFMLNQDTGGAIRGPGRADFFWGSGGYAEVAAGHFKHTGSLYFLVLKPA